MPGVVASYVQSIQSDEDCEAYHVLLNLLENQYMPPTYEDIPDHDFEEIWTDAQFQAAKDLKRFKRANPGLSSVQLLALWKKQLAAADPSEAEEQEAESK